MIAASSNRISYAGNGSSTVFSFPFSWTASSAVKVVTRNDDNASLSFGIETVKTLTTHYTLTGTSGAEGTGSVTFLVAPALNTTVTVIGNESYTQGVDFIENSSMPAEVQEAALDRLTRLVQQVKSASDRKVGLTEGFANTFNTNLPATVYGLAGYLLGIKPSEDGFAFINPASVAGPTGPQGPGGVSGPPGATGLTGPSGSAGATGTGLTLGNKGDITVAGAAFDQWSVNFDRITNSMLVDVPQNSFKSRLTAGMGDPLDITATQATAILDAMIGDSGAGGLKGLIPAPPAGATSAGKFLKADGTWAVPPGGGGGSGYSVLFGSTVPGSGLGIDGDVYIRTTTGGFYKKATGAWTLQYTDADSAATIAANKTLSNLKTPLLNSNLNFLVNKSRCQYIGWLLSGVTRTVNFTITPSIGSPFVVTYTSNPAHNTGQQATTLVALFNADASFIAAGFLAYAEGTPGEWNPYEPVFYPAQLFVKGPPSQAFTMTNDDAAFIDTFAGNDQAATTGSPGRVTNLIAPVQPQDAATKAYVDTAIAAAPGGVTSVYTRTGAVVATAGDYTATQVTNAPTGNISSVTVQAALNELQGDIDTNAAAITLKAPIASPTFTGTPAAPTAAAGTSTTQLATTAFAAAAITAIRSSGVFTGTSVTPAAGALDQTALYTGGSAQTFSTTGFGTLASLPNGYRCLIMGSSDTNTISIADSDIADGRLMNGDAILGKGFTLRFEYNSTLARMVEISRNF